MMTLGTFPIDDHADRMHTDTAIATERTLAPMVRPGAFLVWLIHYTVLFVFPFNNPPVA